MNEQLVRPALQKFSMERLTKIGLQTKLELGLKQILVVQKPRRSRKPLVFLPNDPLDLSSVVSIQTMMRQSLVILVRHKTSPSVYNGVIQSGGVLSFFPAIYLTVSWCSLHSTSKAYTIHTQRMLHLAQRKPTQNQYHNNQL